LNNLVEKLRGYEKAHEEITNAFNISNNELIALANELPSAHKVLQKSASKSNQKNMSTISKSGSKNNENHELVKTHYEDTSCQINHLKSKNS
jgi:hypothetical protein